MSTVVANDLKTKGIKAIEEALQSQTEAQITISGKIKYVVMSHQQYLYLRECELEAALAEWKSDILNGKFVKESVEQHITRLKQINEHV